MRIPPISSMRGSIVIISVCYVFPITPFGFLLTWKSNEVWASWKRDFINWFVSFFAEKDNMFSRFSETAKNSPFVAPFSVAKCSSESTPAPRRRTRIMASPNTDGRFNRRFCILPSQVLLAILKKSCIVVMLQYLLTCLMWFSKSKCVSVCACLKHVWWSMKRRRRGMIWAYSHHVSDHWCNILILLLTFNTEILISMLLAPSKEKTEFVRTNLQTKEV